MATLTDKMLETMALDDIKAAKLTVKLVYKDGSKRKGTYIDLCADPLKRYDYRDTVFLKLATPSEDNMISYIPITLISDIEWSA